MHQGCVLAKSPFTLRSKNIIAKAHEGGLQIMHQGCVLVKSQEQIFEKNRRMTKQGQNSL